MRKKFAIHKYIVALVAFLIAGTALPSSVTAEKLPSKADQSCLKCHDYDKQDNVLAGKIKDVSRKANAIQLQIGSEMEIILFDDSTVLKNADSIPEIPKGEAVKITYSKRDGKTFATDVEVKKGLEVPKEQLVSTEEVEQLVAKGPKEGKYILLDSRPANMFNEGHIPTAASMPFFAFDKLADKLLTDKNVLQIYYCNGVSCVLSPLAARKAEKLGFTNVKVYRDGIPDWKKAGNIVVSNIAGMEALDKLDMPYILIDLRTAAEIAKAHIPKAISAPAKGLDSFREQFPKFKAAAIIIYDNDGVNDKSRDAYKTISGWEYTNVSILSGGFKAWQAAGKSVAEGPVKSKIDYVRKLFPGEVELAVFTRELQKPSKDIILLDVRMPSELQEGALPNTRHIALDDLEARVSELPKDKEILVHCGTGARAEMAYNVLKNAGYKARFLKAKLEFDKEKKGAYKFEE